MNNDFRYKGFRAGFQLHARVGGKVLSATQAYLDGYGVSKASAAAATTAASPSIRARWTPRRGTPRSAPGKVYSHYIYNATNIRLQEASIGYTLPSGGSATSARSTSRWWAATCG